MMPLYINSGKPLDKREAQALRQADTICLDVNKEGGEFVSKIRAIKKIKDSPWGEDRTVTVPVNASVDISTIDPETRKMDVREILEACYQHLPMYHTLESSPIRTIMSLVKAGDEITVKWYGTNSTPWIDDDKGSYADQAVTMHPGYKHQPLCHDRVYIIIRRRLSRKDKVMEFLVSTGVCPNNSARMIRTNRL